MLSPFDTQYPAVRNLQPELLQAVQAAADGAAADDVSILINSGWRSQRYQQYLLDQAVEQYGSETEARKWVNTPEQSTHVTGQAVDIGPDAADRWLARHGNAYGLCQIYANEPWHFERVVEPGGVCPPQISDAAEGRLDRQPTR
jgi:LAS superfamily LD-carboxypeptidase LdcB